MSGLLTAGVVTAPAANAAPGGDAYVVSLGDSYIAGEAGRWAGNSNKGEKYIDALGSSAYFDNATNNAEQITRCHRSKSAEIFLGDGVNGVNLSCSGARTATFTDSNGNFKPGLDFYSSGSNQGQALALQNFAATHRVTMVVVSIGGNDFAFKDIVTSCVADFLASPSWWKDYCSDDSSVVKNFTAANIATQTANVAQALKNVRQAMVTAGYADSEYKIVVQNYMSPIPTASGFRYSQSGYTRQSTGGCGFWDGDADWANNTALVAINGAVRNGVTQSGLTNVVTLDLASAFNGHRLCEKGVGLIEETGVGSWSAPGAVDKSEWINQIRTVSTATTNYYIQESIHPNYWGQLALRNCVRQAYNNGAIRGGTCNISGAGLNALGEPNMALR
ncbi:hypothetical protein [Agromyces protaetiae]|nr:hypothetical protein [Agromyces protaetiae]